MILYCDIIITIFVYYLGMHSFHSFYFDRGLCKCWSAHNSNDTCMLMSGDRIVYSTAGILMSESLKFNTWNLKHCSAITNSCAFLTGGVPTEKDVLSSHRYLRTTCDCFEGTSLASPNEIHNPLNLSCKHRIDKPKMLVYQSENRCPYLEFG